MTAGGEGQEAWPERAEEAGIEEQVRDMEATQEPANQVRHQQIQDEHAHQVPCPQTALGEGRQLRHRRPRVRKGRSFLRLEPLDGEVEHQAQPP